MILPLLTNYNDQFAAISVTKQIDIEYSLLRNKMVVSIGTKAPNIGVSKWVQGLPTNIDKEKENVVLVEVFQVNCPGCFMYGIPQAIEIYQKYRKEGVTVLGLATAFEDFDKNTLENLELLLTKGEVIGETLKALDQHGKLVDGKMLPYKIPFPVAMDILKKEEGAPNKTRIDEIIANNVPGFESYDDQQKSDIIERVKQYIKNKEFSAQTFEEFALRGTPSTILIDKKGILRDVAFGTNDFLEENIEKLLNE
jgi:thiol-disulfide isomerase/thioredoxin